MHRRRPSPTLSPSLLGPVLLGLALLLTLVGAGPLDALSSVWDENPQSRVRLITPDRVAPRHGEVWLGLHFQLTPDWHVYWKNSGDAGFPPEIDLSATPELGNAELLYPAPERYDLPGGLVAYGYGEEVVYPVRATMAAPALDRVTLTVDLGYLVCRVDCVPYQYTLTIEQPVGREPITDPETAPLLEHWRGRLPRAVSDVPEITTEGSLDVTDPVRPVLVVTVEGAAPPEGATPQIFLEHHELFGMGRPVLDRHADGAPGRLRFRVPLEPRRRLDEPPRTSRFAWTVTDLGDPPAIAASRAVPARRLPPGGTVDAPATPDGRKGDRAWAVAGLLLRALAGGLVLALTPGSLALLLAFLGGFRAFAASEHGADETRRALPLGLAAATGAVACAVAAALVGLAEASAGSAAGWGAHLAEPTSLTALALLTLLVALWLWGFVGDAHRRLTPRGLGTGPAAAAGAVGTLLALPWPIPPVPGVVDRAFALDASAGGGPLVLILAAACLGCGLGLPWLLGALWTERAPDRGSERTDGDGGRLREGLGFLAVLPVFWLLYLLSAQLRTEYLAFVELALLGLALVAWGWRKSRSTAVRATLAALLLALAVATVWLADRGQRTSRTEPPDDAPRRAALVRAVPWDNARPE